MTMEGTYSAVIDRIVDDETAVLLLEADGEVVDQFDVPLEAVPEVCSAGSVLTVTVVDNRIVEMIPDPVESEDRRARISAKFDRLSKRLGEDESNDGDESDAEPDEEEE